MAAYLYKLVPDSGLRQIGDEVVVEQTVSSDKRYEVGDIAPGWPGTWTVERVDAPGTTKWASEAVGRIDPQTTSPITIYCRIDP